MNQKIDLNKIEKKAYMAFHKDGLWDLAIGLTFLFIAMGSFNDNFLLTPIIATMVIILVPILRKSVILPRLGYVRFSAQRQAREKHNRYSLTILFTLTAFLGSFVFLIYSMDMPFLSWVRDLGIIPFGFVLALVSAVVGHLYDLKRCLVYSMIVMAVFITGHILDYKMSFPFFFIGGTLSVVGFTMLVRFLISNPKPTGEENHVSEG
jgi:hypothetical protein